MKFWKSLAAAAGALLLSALLCACGETPFTIGILAQGEGGALIQGEALQQIPYGGDVTYGITLPIGESVVQVFVDDVLTEDYTFEDDKLTLYGMTAPATVRVVSGKADQLVYWETNVMGKNGGSVRSNVTDGAVAAGSRITLTAVPNEGAVFLGWTERFALESGGTLLSEEEQVTVEVNDFSYFIANFDTSGIPEPEKKTSSAVSQNYKGPNTYTIYYHINGGNVMAEDRVAIETTFDTSYWSMPVGREDDGKMTRDGYILLGYTTDPEGTGELIRPGHKFKLPTTDKMFNLYCVWQKETDASLFTVSDLSDSTVQITGYTGTDSVVYIPRKINGKTVKQIAVGAFKGNEHITEVHITSSITAVANDAFSNCPSLTTITIYDNVQQITDFAFKNTPIQTMRLCAATSPRYVNSYINFSIKYERLMMSEGTPRIVVVAGSSKYWGLDTDLMESLVDDKYTVVNYGTSVGMNILFFLEAVTSYLTEDDVLVFAPEQYGVNAYHSNGNPEMPSATFQGIASSYNLMERVDISNYTNVFTSFAEFCTWRSQTSTTAWDSYSPKLDRYGDYTGFMTTLNVPEYYGSSLGYFRFDEKAIPEEFRDNLNRTLDNAAAACGEVLFSYPPHNLNAVLPVFKKEKAWAAYNTFIDETVHARRISDLANYMHEAPYFDDSDYHLNGIGREIHTRQLTEDLIAAGAVTGK